MNLYPLTDSDLAYKVLILMALLLGLDLAHLIRLSDVAVIVILWIQLLVMAHYVLYD